MLKNLRNVFIALVLAIGVIFVGAAQTEAASLKDNQYVSPKAVIVMEIITNKDFVEVVDLTPYESEFSAENFIRKVVPGKNVRFVSDDQEMVNSWRKCAVKVGYEKSKKVKEIKDKKLSMKTISSLNPGQKYAFEIKTIQTGNKFGWEEGVGIVTAVAGFASLFID